MNNPTTPTSISCPQGLPCDPVECRRAFKCGALPILDPSGVNEKDAFLFGIGLVAVLVGFFGMTMTILFALGLLGKGERPGSVWEVALVFVGLECVVCLGAAGWMWLRRNYLRARVRAIARAARELGLDFCMRTRAEQTNCTSPPRIDRAGQFQQAEELMQGVIEGISVRVLYYEYSASSPELYPALEPVRLVGLLTGNDMKETTAARYGQYVVVADVALTQLPDFLLCSKKAVLVKYLAKKHRAQAITFRGSYDGEKFAENYDLYGSDASRLKTLFGSRLQQALLKMNACEIQCHRGELVAWNRTWAAFDFSAFPRQSSAVAEDIRRVAEVLRLLAKGDGKELF